jgi:hypothetical protein
MRCTATGLSLRECELAVVFFLVVAGFFLVVVLEEVELAVVFFATGFFFGGVVVGGVVEGVESCAGTAQAKLTRARVKTTRYRKTILRNCALQRDESKPLRGAIGPKNAAFSGP